MTQSVVMLLLCAGTIARGSESVPVRTLPDGALDIAHDEAVLVVQELDADLRDLQPRTGQQDVSKRAAVVLLGAIVGRTSAETQLLHAVWRALCVPCP